MKLFFLYSAVHSIVVNVNDKAAVKALAAKTAAKLNSLYVPTGSNRTSDGKGCFPQHKTDGDPTSFSWYECGVFWSSLMDYTQITGDTQFGNNIVNAVTLASYGKVGSFLGSDKGISAILGVWNDDLMWWALVPLAGAEIYGKDQAMPGGIGYLDLAIESYNEANSDWTDECDGGIYWSRARQSTDERQKYYKSAISNAQHLLIGSQIYNITNEKKYLDLSYRMFNWIAEKLIFPDYMTADGINVQSRVGPCSMSLPLNGTAGVYTAPSYIYGSIVAAMASFYSVSKNSTHLSFAEKIASKALDLFQTDGIITDYCDPKCDVTSVAPKGIFVRGLGVLYQVTQDQKLKDTIKTRIQKSVVAMLAYCDDNMNCNSASWNQSQILNANNIHIAMNNLELMNALSIIMNGVSDQHQAPPTQPPPVVPTSPDPADGAIQNMSILYLIALAGYMIGSKTNGSKQAPIIPPTQNPPAVKVDSNPTGYTDRASVHATCCPCKLRAYQFICSAPLILEFWSTMAWQIHIVNKSKQ
ncbi:hydrolase 76 protein [Boothiomyces sp. JEL0866]|nr:hydrolase 76 protein [Boothiomyces sp. JEL0866]